jgi:hypothetical protein
VESNLTLVVYVGGTCGDLIGALIDPSCAEVSGTIMLLDPEQQKLKKPHNFVNDEQKDNYIKNVQFKSIVSHDTEYHKRKKHNFISIVIDDYKLAVWAATRFKNLHRPHVWEEMKKIGGAKDINEYAQLLINYSSMIKNYANHTINLEDIISGNAIIYLNSFVPTTEKSNILYKKWLIANQL